MNVGVTPDNGFGRPSEPILKPLDTIKHMDAVLAFDEHGNPYQPEWPAADVIIGNPPFLGGGKLRAELGSTYTEAIFKLYGNSIPNFSDFVCYWFERSRLLINQGAIQRAGLLATNSIRGGANRTVLERIKNTGNIFMAWSDRPWILNGAAVRVSMVGFDNAKETKRTLNNLEVTAINSDLTSTLDLTDVKPLSSNAGISFIGPSPKASFDINNDVAQQFIKAPLNINGRPNTDVIRPVISGIDIVRKSRNKWTIDFASMEENTASEYEAPFEYVKTYILPERKNRRDDYRGQWWQYARPRPEMRQALSGLQRFIATSRVAKYRIFVWVDSNILSNDGTVVFARTDDYFFGVLHSKFHELWSLRMGTELEDRPRYTPTTTFETFPFPWALGQEPNDDPRIQAIAESACELVEKRDNWLNPAGASAEELKKRTLTNLYNQRPTWLDNIHKKLDKAVFAAYGWPDSLTDEEILERLLKLNQERAAAQ